VNAVSVRRQGLRRMQPFSYNTLRPCPFVDHPKAMRTALKRFNAYPTHERAERTFTELADGLDDYSREVEELYTPIWAQECVGAQKWMEAIAHPPEKCRARKRAYDAGREKMMTAAPR
jgi:hypothetical protein